MSEVSGSGLDQALSGVEEDMEAHIAWMSTPLPWRETYKWLRGGSLTCRGEDLPPSPLPTAWTSEKESWVWSFGACGWITPTPPEISVTVELDELKELYKKNRLKHDKTQTRSYTSHRS